MKQFEVVLYCNTKQCTYMYYLQYMYFILQKRYGEARIYYNKALALDPGNKMVSDNLAKLNRIENSS